ncbi:MAG: hypothetical protein CVU39_12495 [Chloroflexi bacterium HGW-Chloroflexi-10]|nr:MAG: hypothetical protein CVU39_12495 [Chloroflexi bacterium HGW-Chloroflexi-10]
MGNNRWEKPAELVINGEIWLQVPDFSQSTAYDRHFVVKYLNSGNEVFVFGNGKKGIRPGDRYPGFASAFMLSEVEEEQPQSIGEIDIPIPSILIPEEPRLSGIYRAVIISNDDPEGRLRMQVKIDSIPEVGLLWATPVLPLVENELIRPNSGDVVWVSFQNGDPQQPLWLGKISENDPSTGGY